MKLAAKHSIHIDFFYREAGHGRGFIDAMASFGCKGPLRKEIIDNDAWFENAAQMHTFVNAISFSMWGLVHTKSGWLARLQILAFNTCGSCNFNEFSFAHDACPVFQTLLALT